MRKALIEFLKALEEAWPPPEGCHHPLMYAKFGSDSTGWEDQLMLQVNWDGTFYPFFLDDNDLKKPINQLVAEIVELLEAPKPGNWQVSNVAAKVGDVE